jgi:hypothetical protein
MTKISRNRKIEGIQEIVFKIAEGLYADDIDLPPEYLFHFIEHDHRVLSYRNLKVYPEFDKTYGYICLYFEFNLDGQEEMKMPLVILLVRKAKAEAVVHEECLQQVFELFIDADRLFNQIYNELTGLYKKYSKADTEHNVRVSRIFSQLPWEQIRKEVMPLYQKGINLITERCNNMN